MEIVDNIIKSLELILDNFKLLKKQEIFDELDSLVDTLKKGNFETKKISTKNFDTEEDELEFYKKNLQSVIKQRDGAKYNCEYAEKPRKFDAKPFNEKILTKLNILFRKRIFISENEAELNCENYLYLENRYNTFLDLIDWINDNDFSLLVDRLLFCSFLHIKLEAYERFLVSSDENIRSIFLSIENMYISQKTNASELGTRNPNATRTNLSYEKVGAGLTPNDNNNTAEAVKDMLNIAEIMRKARSLGYSPNDEKSIVDYDYTRK